MQEKNSFVSLVYAKTNPDHSHHTAARPNFWAADSKTFSEFC